MSITNSRSLPRLMSIESLMLSNHLILCHPLLLLPSIFPGIRVFSNETPLCIRWPKYWSFSFSISPSNEHPGLISFRMDWLALKSLLQHHSSEASVLQFSAFFMVQLSHLYVTALSAKWCLYFLICCLGLSELFSQEANVLYFMVAVTVCSDFGAQENKICHCFHFFPLLFVMK